MTTKANQPSGSKRKTAKDAAARKPATTLPIHPAIVAIRAEHAAYAARQPAPVSTCYASDLVHDERAIRAAGSSGAFGWVLTPHSTHLVWVPRDAGDARAELARRASARASALPAAVAEAYGACACYLWDGRALRPQADAATLTRALDACTARVALADAERRRTEAREDLAAAGPGPGVWHARCASALAQIEAEIEHLTTEFLDS